MKKNVLYVAVIVLMCSFVGASSASDAQMELNLATHAYNTAKTDVNTPAARLAELKAAVEAAEKKVNDAK